MAASPFRISGACCNGYGCGWQRHLLCHSCAAALLPMRGAQPPPSRLTPQHPHPPPVLCMALLQPSPGTVVDETRSLHEMLTDDDRDFATDVVWAAGERRLGLLAGRAASCNRRGAGRG